MRSAVASAVLALGCALAVACEVNPPAESRPNVVLIVLDTTRADALRGATTGESRTPRIDALAAEGTSYTRAYSTSFWTLPAHASLLTGLHPSLIGATSETNRLPPGPATLAELLSDAGYRTGAIVRNAWLAAERGFGRGFHDFDEAWRVRGPPARVELRTASKAAEWIQSKAALEAPFFLLVNFNVAHLPYFSPSEYWERVRSRPWPKSQVKRLRSITGMWSHLAGALELSDSDLVLLRELYSAQIAVADDLVGRIVDALVGADLLDDTLLILTSDHGENLGEHGKIDHLLSMYETTLRIPLTIRYPARFPGGQQRDELVSLVDIAPTILEICGLDAGATGRSGRSLVSREVSPPRFVIAENDRPLNGVELLREQFPDFDAGGIDHPQRALITDRYKLIWHLPERFEIYDLERDPDELVDLSPHRTPLHRELIGQLREWQESVGRVVTPAERLESQDAEAIERLRSLGYLR